MKRIFILSTWILSVGVTIVRGQGYYPLHVGDQWQYLSYDIGDTMHYSYTRTVDAETVMNNGYTYWVSSSGIFGSHFERYSESKIYIYNFSTGEDQLVFDYYGSPGDTIASIPSEGDTTDIILVSVSPSYNTGLLSGRWTVLLSHRQILDGDSWLTITDSIGVVAMTGPGPFFNGYYLEGALIDGKIIGNFVNVEPPHKLPGYLQISRNYPNPFNPSTTIDIRVQAMTTLNISVFNLMGGLVYTGVDKLFHPGAYQFTWTPTDVPGGVYFLRIQQEDRTYSRKVVYLR